MEKVLTEKFNQGKLTVWFIIDNIRHYDENQKIIEKEDEFICFFNFKDHSPKRAPRRLATSAIWPVEREVPSAPDSGWTFV